MPVVLLIVFLLALPAVAQDVEALCTSLGPQCMCSETFNVQDDLPNSESHNWNPSNSVTKQCGDGCQHISQCDGPVLHMGGSYQTKSANVRADSVMAFPSGANPWVYQGGLLVLGTGLQHIVPDAAQDVQNETICSRVYRFYDADVPSPLLDGDRIKLDGHHFYTDAGVLLGYTTTQWSFGSTGPAAGAYVQWVMDVGPYDVPEPPNADYAGFQAKAKAGWVRSEICSDVGNGTLHLRSRMVYLSDSTTVERSSPTLTGGPSVIDVVPGTSSLMADGPSINSAPPDAYQYVSHYMQARVPYNESFWIGPAHEVENLETRTCP